jgi:hypothetical protein
VERRRNQPLTLLPKVERRRNQPLTLLPKGERIALFFKKLL